ncbi:TPA: electron transfer flavoprotein subunit alpha/FixB family protein [Candidatus Poribacteria bacterium]|nr:electron transfer flavoprotein subunit alpha/FixB family protein [Candidatus Poribacteria bacterium]
MKILIIVEQQNGQLLESSLELFGIPFSDDAEIHAALLCNHSAALVDTLISHNVTTIHLAQDPALDNYLAESHATVLTRVIESESPDVVLAACTSVGRDLMPHLAVLLNVGLASDCVSISFEDGNLIARRPLYAGKASVEIEFIDQGTKLVSVRPQTFPIPKPNSGNAAEIENVVVNLPNPKTVLKDCVVAESKRPDLAEVAIVVSGGRSLGSVGNFKIIEEFADQIGAAVGASRAAVDLGYRPYQDQVGLTGKVVSPEVYIACGISGAIQHLAGMRTSKNVIAINTDPNAPIFQISDYGVVGDLFTILPLLTQMLQ